MKPDTKKILYAAFGVLMVSVAMAQDRPSIRGSTPAHPPLQKAPPSGNKLGIDIGFPDFRPTKIKVLATGQYRAEVEVYVDVTQSGTVTSPATTVTITATLDLPGNIGQPQTRQNTVPMLASGTTQRIYVGTVGVPDRDSDWDIEVTAVVDPSGQVPETTDSNNTLSYTCRLYGADPDLTGPEACN